VIIGERERERERERKRRESNEDEKVAFGWYFVALPERER
jgi:hypothetical protein